MRSRIAALRADLRPMLSLALPVVLAELGWMAMGVVDTMMVGRVSAESIGAVSVGRALFFTVSVFGMGLLLGLDTLVSTAYGAGHLDECHRSLLQGTYLSLILGLPLTALLLLCSPLLARWGLDPGVLDAALPYVRAISWSVVPLLVYTALRRYLQGVGRVHPVMIALISANLINVAGNWVLVFGKLGAPALGAEGAGWATCISSVYLVLFLLAAVLIHDREERGGLLRAPWRLDAGRMRRLLGLGLPAALHLVIEVAVFAGATALAGWLDPTALAAHQIALTAASVTFMVPLGISSAGAVRVGQALGRRDPAAAERAGWTALVLGGMFMLFAAAVFLLLPRLVVRIFTAEPSVIAAGISLLAVAAFFQLSDGIQVVATGILRGAGDTRTPLACNLVGHWVLGLPVGYVLCFRLDWGVVGLWFGWFVGLTTVALVLLFVWARTSRGFDLRPPVITG